MKINISTLLINIFWWSNDIIRQFLGQKMINYTTFFADAKKITPNLNTTNLVEETNPYDDGFMDAYYTGWLKYCPKKDGIMSLQCKVNEEAIKSMSGVYKYKKTSSVLYDLGYKDGYKEVWWDHCVGRLNKINFADCDEDRTEQLKRYIEENKEGINVPGVGVAYGLTMLHIASKLGEPELINSLMKNGADLHVKNKEGQTPLQFGIQHRQKESIKCLLKYDDNFSNAKSSIKIKDVEIKSIDKTIPVAFVLFDDGNRKIISSETLDLSSFKEILEWAKDNNMDLGKNNFDLNLEDYVEDNGIYYSSTLSIQDLREDL